jgi:DNA helicase HerA-like ATPase
VAVTLWHGIPGCGKSTAMRAALAEAVRSSGKPAIVLDPGRVDQWLDLPRGGGLVDIHRIAWKERGHVAAGLLAEDAERLAKALEATGREAGGFIYVIDELREYASHKVVGENLVLLARRHRHARVDLMLGTQSIGDVRTDLLSAVDTIYTGRNVAPYNLDTLRQRFGLDPERVKALNRGEFLRTGMGF